MPAVEPKHKNESFEQLFRRFKRGVDKADIIKCNPDRLGNR